MCRKLKTIYIISLFHFLRARATSEIRIVRRELQQRNVITLSNNFHSSYVFPYAFCDVQEYENRKTSDHACHVVLETLTRVGDKYRDSCRTTFHNVIQNADKSTDVVMDLASEDVIVFGYKKRQDEVGEYVYVHRILNMLTCNSYNIEVALGDRQPSLLEKVTVFVKSNDNFGAIYQMPELCGVDVCEIIFSTEGEIIEDLQPLTQHTLPIQEYIDFKEYYPIGGYDQSKYFVLHFQAHDHNIFHIPFNYENLDITLLEMTTDRYTTLKTIKIEGLDYDIYGSRGFFDVDTSHNLISTCIATKFYLKEKRTIIKCMQLDIKWNKTLTVESDVSYNVKMLKIKNLSRGKIALLTHDENGDFYVRRIESNGVYGKTLVLEKIGEDLVFSSLNTGKFYEGEHGNLCLMSLSYREYFGMVRACFPKRLLN